MTSSPSGGTPTAPLVRPAAVEFRDVYKTYSEPFFWRRPVAAVQGVSLRVEPGEVVALLGPNRAGKTTLVKILLCLCRLTSGSVERLGRPLTDRRTLGRVGYVHENHAFPRYLNARELLHYYGALSFVPLEVLKSRVPQLLERVGLADRAREPIARFSKGMIQRLGIAQALINEPLLLVLDEPTEGLDLSGRQLLRGVVAEVKQRGGSVLLVSHALTEVEQVSDRLAVLVQGRLTHVGPLADLPRPLEKTAQELYARAVS